MAGEDYNVFALLTLGKYKIESRMMATITSSVDPTEIVENPHTMIINMWESYCAGMPDGTLNVPTNTCNCDTAVCQAGLY